MKWQIDFKRSPSFFAASVNVKRWLLFIRRKRRFRVSSETPLTWRADVQRPISSAGRHVFEAHAALSVFGKSSLFIIRKSLFLRYMATQRAEFRKPIRNHREYATSALIHEMRRRCHRLPVEGPHNTAYHVQIAHSHPPRTCYDHSYGIDNWPSRYLAHKTSVIVSAKTNPTHTHTQVSSISCSSKS